MVRRNYVYCTCRWNASHHAVLAQNRDFCLPHLHSTPTLGEFPSIYCHAVWYGKARMACLPDGEKISKICLFTLTECTNVADRWTDAQTHGQAARLKKRNVVQRSNVQGRLSTQVVAGRAAFRSRGQRSRSLEGGNFKIVFGAYIREK